MSTILVRLEAPEDQPHGAAADPEGHGLRDKRRLGRLAVHGRGADMDYQGAVVFATYPRPRRHRLNPNGNPHGSSIRENPGRIGGGPVHAGVP